MDRFTITDVRRRVESIAALIPGFDVTITAPGDGFTRYAMPWGHVAAGAREACALLDAYRMGVLHGVADGTADQRHQARP